MRKVRTTFVTLVTGLLLLAPAALVVHASTPSKDSSALVQATSSKILVTSKGLTLYAFALDKPNVSNCTGTCAKFWPPLTVPAGMQAPTTMPGISGKFGTTMRKDGTKQITFDQSPLYTFVKDKDSSDMYGQGLFASGGFWWAVAVPGSKHSGGSGS